MSSKNNLFSLYSDYKNLYLYQSSSGTILFRLLPYDRVRVVEKLIASYPSLKTKIEDDIWDECIIESSFPSSLDDLDAGIITTISQLIIRLSCPTSIQEINSDLDAMRNELTDIRDQIITKICEAFPAYSPEDVERMDWQTQLKRLTQAEKILGMKFELNTGESKKGSNTGIATKIGSDGLQYIDFEKENANFGKSE